MEEFKIIPDAINYKINKIGEVQRMNGTKVFMMAGDMVLLKNNEGINEQFEVNKLVKELFDNVAEDKKYVNPDPIESNIQPTENKSDKNETNESEDQELIKEEAVIPPAVKKGRGRHSGSKNKNVKNKPEKEKKEKRT